MLKGKWLMIVLALAGSFWMESLSFADESVEGHDVRLTNNSACLNLPAISPVRQKGFSYTSWWHDSYNTADSDTSIEKLGTTGTEWVSLLVTWYQDTGTSTAIYRDGTKTPTDGSLIHAINKIHASGMKVMLKPHVDCKNGTWRGQIQPADWDAWFGSYTEFINHYADLAQTNGVEQFCAGCELETSVSHENEWKGVISEVRGTFTGPITYAANWDGYQKIGFWDALDYAGVDAYFPLTGKNDPTIPELIDGWNKWAGSLTVWQAGINKPVIFTEIGYRSMDGANKAPWEWTGTGTVDLQEQADCYEAAFQVFWNKPWFYGMYWWNWETSPNQGGTGSLDYTPYKKPAEEVLRGWYRTGLITESGSLIDAVKSLESKTIGKCTYKYQIPTGSDTTTMKNVVGLITTGQLNEAATAALPLGYEIVQFSDTVTSRIHYILRERTPYNRGWGSYIFDSNSGSSRVIEAPHPLFDMNTPEIGIKTYIECGAGVFLLAGAHRDANGTGTADVAHLDSSIFQGVHEVVVGSATYNLQVHGFSRTNHPDYPDVVLSAGDGSQPDILTKISEKISDKGFSVGTYNGTNWGSLSATTNVQGSYTRSVDGKFIHIELESSIRGSSTQYAEVIQAIKEAFIGSVTTLPLPIVTIITPKNGTILTDSEITLSGTVTGADYGTLTHNRISSTLLNITGGSFTTSLTLSSGKNTVMVVVQNQAGDVGSAAIIVELVTKIGTIIRDQNPKITLPDKTEITVIDNPFTNATATITINDKPVRSSFALADRNLPKGVNISGLAEAVREFKLCEGEDITQATSTGRFKIAIPYPTGISDDKAGDLRIYRCDPVDDRWELVGGTVSIQEHTVSCEVDHLSVFRVAFKLEPDLNSIRVYPNPSYGDEVIFAGLTNEVRIRIFTLAGEQVFDVELTAPQAGKYLWNCRNSEGEKLASGVYVYLVTNQDEDRKTGKLAIIR